MIWRDIFSARRVNFSFFNIHSVYLCLSNFHKMVIPLLWIFDVVLRILCNFSTLFFSEELARQLQAEEVNAQEPQRPNPSSSRPQNSPGRSQQSQNSQQSNNNKKVFNFSTFSRLHLNKLPQKYFFKFSFFSALSCKRKYLSCQSNRQSTSNWSPSKFFSTDLCIFIREHTQLLELSVNTKKVFIHEKLCNCAISYATQSEY